VPGGADTETGETLYVARAEHEGAIIPGKFVPSHGVTYISWGGAEHGKSEYEVSELKNSKNLQYLRIFNLIKRFL
jgi:hypothetical protein